MEQMVSFVEVRQAITRGNTEAVEVEHTADPRVQIIIQSTLQPELADQELYYGTNFDRAESFRGLARADR